VKIIDLSVLPLNCKHSKLWACFCSGEKKSAFCVRNDLATKSLIRGHLLPIGAGHLRKRAVTAFGGSFSECLVGYSKRGGRNLLQLHLGISRSMKWRKEILS